MASENEIAAMRRAIEIAARGLPTASPRPVVGCVVLDSAGTVVGEGFFERAGEPHAEVHALRAAGERARGGTAVVTLEPCNHYGRTPPCRQALIQAGIARVVYAVADPNPVAAGGADALRAAGVEVEGGVLEAEAERGNEAWLTAMRCGRPHVTWAYTIYLDGRCGGVNGPWPASEQARADLDWLRAISDAAMVGSGTQRAEDPPLTTRHPKAARQPLRVVVDTSARTPATARALEGGAPALVAVADGADAGHLAGHAEVVGLPCHDRGLDLRALLQVLHERAVRSVLVEGSCTLARSLLAEGLVDRAVSYVVPLLDAGGVPLPSSELAARLAMPARHFRIDEVVHLGPDVRLTARPAARAASR